MSGLSESRLELQVLKPSKSPLLTSTGCPTVATDTRRRSRSRPESRTGLVLRDALERHDGRVRPSAAMLDAELDDSAWPPPNQRVRSCAGRAARPSDAGFESRRLHAGNEPK